MDQTRQTVAHINASRAARREGPAARREWGRRFLDERRRLRREAAALWRPHRGA